jgi:hypothetical protein
VEGGEGGERETEEAGGMEELEEDNEAESTSSSND